MKLKRISAIFMANAKSFKLEGNYSKAFYWLLAFSFLYLLPILIANFYYIDDVGRSFRGNISWNSDGRPLMKAIVVFLSNGKPIMDVSPWMQIAAVIVLDYALVLFLRKYVSSASALQIFCVAACSYANWFLLENVSYKYESLGMLTSISIPFVLYSLPETMDIKKQVPITIIAVLISIGTYVSLAVLEAVYHLTQKTAWKQIARQVTMRAGAILAGSLLYKLTIAKRFVPQTGYSSEHAHLVRLSSQGIYAVYHHLLSFGAMWKEHLQTLNYIGVLLVVAMCIGIIHLAFVVWRSREESFAVKLGTLFFILATPILLMVSSVIAMLVLEHPIFTPRVMLSFTVVTLFAGLMIYHLSQVHKGFLVIAGLTLMITLSFSSAYGNLLTRQDQTNSLVAARLARDMDEIEMQTGQTIKYVSFIGHSPKCKELLLYAQKRPLLNRLVPIYMNDNWYWGGSYLSHFRTEQLHMLPDKVWSKKADLTYISQRASIRHNEFYQLYLQQNRIIVVFPRTK